MITQILLAFLTMATGQGDELPGRHAALYQDPQLQTPAAPRAGATPETQETEVADVVVVGELESRLTRRYVETIGARAGNRQLATWRGKLCVSVANLPGHVAQYMIDRVSELAMEVGVEPGEPGCTANVLIVATNDGAGVAGALVAEHRAAFRPGAAGTTQPLSALEDFRTSTRPVRWWHVSVPVDSETGAIATRLPGEEAPMINVSRASRLRSDIRDDLNKAIIVIDVNQLGGTTFDQLTDYVALVALAQIDARADTSGLPTILNLFDDPQGSPGLSDWDRAYLHALYGAEPGHTSANAQTGELARLMSRVQSTDAPLIDR